MHTVKPVSLEMELDFHERLIHTVGKSIASTKKRLHDAELVLNLRPSDNDTSEMEEWNAKVSQLIDRRGPLQFPTLYQVRKEYESKALIKSIRTGRQKIESDEKFNQRMSRELAREAEMIKKKILSNSAAFGKKTTGDTIRTIDGYKGGNTLFEGSRTLIIKDGHYVPIDPAKSSTPAWIGPGHYPNAAKVPKHALHESQARVPFKAQPRDATSGDILTRTAVERRRRQINEFKERLSASGSQASVTSSRARSGSLESLYTAFGEGSSALTSSVGRPKPTALELAKADMLGEDSDLEFMVNGATADDAGSLTSSLTRGSSLARSRGSTGAGNKKPSVLFEDDADPAQFRTEESLASTPRTAGSSLFGQTRSKGILKSQRHAAPMPVRRRAPVLNPVYSRKDLTLKLIRADERVNSQFFKVNDYTMNAFALHSPEVAYIEEFEPADAEGAVDPAAGVYQNRPTGPFRKPKPIGTFTSDIFVVKPPEYVPPKPAERQERSPTVVARPGGDGLSRSASAAAKLAPLTKTGSSVLGSPGASAKSKASNEGSGAGSQHAKKGQQSPKRLHAPLHVPSPTHRTAKAYQRAVLTKDKEEDRAKCERTIDKVIQRRHNSQYFETQRALVDMDAFSVASSTSVSVAEADDGGGDGEGRPLSAPLNSGAAVRKWLESNDIICANRHKQRVEGTTFLQEHKPLPSIELSLNGLLLDENPYTPDDEFMREMFHRPASEIGR